MADDDFPQNIQVFIDGEDITYYIFGVDKFTPTSDNYFFTDIDISTYINNPGTHRIKVTAETGQGRIDCRVDIA